MCEIACICSWHLTCEMVWLPTRSKSWMHYGSGNIFYYKHCSAHCIAYIVEFVWVEEFSVGEFDWTQLVKIISLQKRLRLRALEFNNKTLLFQALKMRLGLTREYSYRSPSILFGLTEKLTRALKQCKGWPSIVSQFETAWCIWILAVAYDR